MKTRNQDFALGLTVIVFLALFLVTIFFLAPSLGGATRPIVVHFRHVDGLAPLKAGSLVLLSGAIEIGQVTSVEIREVEIESPSGSRRQTIIVARAEIDESLSLYGDCEITTDVPLIGGNGTMVIVNVGTPGVPLPPDHIDGQPPQGMAAFASLSRRLLAEGGVVDRIDRMLDPEAEGSLLNKVKLSLTDINAMTAELKTQLSTQQQKTLLGKIHLILDDLNATTAAVRTQMLVDSDVSLLAKFNTALDLVHQSLTELNAMLQEDRPLLHDTLASIEHATRAINEEMIAHLTAEFDPHNPASLLAKLHVSMDSINTSLANLQVVSETGKHMLVLNRPQLERILENVREMSEELTLSSKEIRLNPSRLIWGPGKAQASKLDLFTAARDFAQAATYLDDAAARLQAILQVTSDGQHLPESGDEVRAIYESLHAAFERFQRAESFFWDQMK